MAVIPVDDGRSSEERPAKFLPWRATAVRLPSPSKVGVLGIVDQRDGGRCDAPSACRFRRGGSCPFDYCRTMRRTQAHSIRGSLNVIIEIAQGGKHGCGRVVTFGSCLFAQDERAHFLDRCFAIAAGYADQRQAETVSPGVGKIVPARAGCRLRRSAVNAAGRPPREFVVPSRLHRRVRRRLPRSVADRTKSCPSKFSPKGK